MMMDPMNAMRNEKEVVRSAGREAISAFLEAHSCFLILRENSKMVLFDKRIPIPWAFYALVMHGTSYSTNSQPHLSCPAALPLYRFTFTDINRTTYMPAAQLWDLALCLFVGLFTVTDFIDALNALSSNQDGCVHPSNSFDRGYADVKPKDI